MSDLLDGLNPAQREAVTSTEGYVRVIAGAGSGKTRALAHRFAYLVCEAGILPENILCVTFTNKSAAEMRQRIHKLTGDNDTGYICTFHSFCVSVLQEDSHAVQYPKNFLVLDNADIDAMLGIIYEERGLTLRHMTYSKARDMIEMRKLFQNPDYYRDLIAMPLGALEDKYRAAQTVSDIIFYGYLYQQKKCFGLDYNDLIKVTLYLFERDADIRLKWQQRMEYIMVDEFQDIDKLQYELMTVLCGYHKNLFVVGDPDQTIYTWRGADIRYLLDFDRAFPGTRTIMLLQNYRSTPQILAVANDLIDKNHNRMDKILAPTRPDGVPVRCHHARTAEAEAAWIAGEIDALHKQGVPYRAMTVLYRAHYVTRTIETVFLHEEIPYTIYSGVQFFCRAEIKDTLSYLRMIAYRDDLSFLRIVNQPRRNIGERRIKFLREAAQQTGTSLYDTLCAHLDDELFKGTKARQFVQLIQSLASDYADRPISEVLAETLDRSGYEKMLRTEGGQERLDNLAELKQSVYEYETTCGEESTLEHYLARVALLTNTDAGGTRDQVRLMTVHTAKGLEFPYVFLCAMNDGIFPSKKVHTWPGMEEERRLAFVALTRAQDGLYLSEAEGRNFDGSCRYPSRFLLDIDPDLLQYTEQPPEAMLAEARDYISLREKYLLDENTELPLAAGDRIVHGVFGPGTIEAVDQTRAVYRIQFDDMKTPRDITFRAKLERE
ncbi:MAG: UvrD-helicase domain-containing protein [Butyricicoccus pullicaecorum]|nr:UvrD-helicase domain-containing protein [Butyricicoccus pullicaecorum]